MISLLFYSSLHMRGYHSTSMEVRGQRTACRSQSSLSMHNAWVLSLNLVFSLSSKLLYSLSHLSTPSPIHFLKDKANSFAHIQPPQDLAHTRHSENMYHIVIP